MNILKKKIGIIGGGQLGKMMILDAKRLGFYVTILDPTIHCPAHSIADNHIVASFDDEDSIHLLASQSDVITYEFEHINVTALEKLEAKGHIIYPTISSLKTIQNKFTQKEVLKMENIPVPAYRKINQKEDINKAIKQFSYPVMLKACTGGYDGKGNFVINNESDIEKSYTQLGNGTLLLMVEEYIQYKMEISVLACRGIDGHIVVYPVGENRHEDSILDETIVPANISKACEEKAMKLAGNVMEVFHGVGMFCVEMFVTDDEEIYINEVAPRPHNSGHYTIEGCITSQFEQHIRAITGLPFGDVSLRCPIVMKNLLGEMGEDGESVVIGLEDAYQNPNVKIHIYGKEEVKSKRKMGHLTVCGKTIEEALLEARIAKEQIKIIARK